MIFVLSPYIEVSVRYDRIIKYVHCVIFIAVEMHTKLMHYFSCYLAL